MVTPLEEDVLQTFHVSLGGVVDNNISHRNSLTDGGLQVAHGHVETSVACHGHHGGFPGSELSADPAGDPIADGGIPPVYDERPARRGGIIEKAGPVGGKTPVGEKDSVGRHGLGQFMTKPSHVNRSLLAG